MSNYVQTAEDFDSAKHTACHNAENGFDLLKECIRLHLTTAIMTPLVTNIRSAFVK